MSLIVTTDLDCGMRLVVEPIPNVASAAINWLLPLGAATDAPESDGHAALLGELIFRGADGLSSREHSDALDRIGLRRSSHVQTHHLQIAATGLGDLMGEALPLISGMVRRPALPADAVDAVRSLCLQSLEALDDDPQQLAMLRLRERHRPPPFNRDGYGSPKVLETASVEELRATWSARCVPAGSIFAAAGRVDPEALAGQLNELLAGWSGRYQEPKASAPPQRGLLHIEQETAQVHIGVAVDAPREADPDSLLERLGVAVLSGSTSSRLFTEVRQKRSLCYSIGASFRAGRDDGMVVLYAGTTPERAQETLDVCLAEITRLTAGVEPEEFHRATVGLKSHLIMQGESTAARAAALGYDEFRLGRARTLEELAASIDAITLDQLQAYLARRKFGPFTVVSVGPVGLSLPQDQAAAPVCG